MLAAMGTLFAQTAAALDGASGRSSEIPLRWRYVPGGLIQGPVVPAPDGGVYFAAEDWYLYRINADGTAAFRFDMRGKPLPLLAPGPDGSVIATTSEGRTLAVSSAGRQVGEADGAAVAALFSDPAGLIYTVPTVSQLVCSNVSGRRLWSVQFDQQLRSVSRVSNGYLLCADSGGRVYALDRWGRFVWTTTIDAKIRAAEYSPGTSRIFVLAEDGKLYCLNRAGWVLWSVAANAAGVSAKQSRQDSGVLPVLSPANTPMSVGADGRVYLLGSDGAISCYGEAGKRSFRAAPPNGQFTGMVAGAGGVYASTDQGMVVLIDGRGVAVATATTPEVTSLARPWVMPDSSVVVDGGNWVVYSFSPMVPAQPKLPVRPTLPAQSRVESSGSGLDRPAWSDDPDYISLSSRLIDGAARDRQGALAELRRRVSGKRLRGSLPYVCYLLGATLDGRVVAAQPAERSEAAAELGYIGTVWARNTLRTAARSENDPAVLGAIARALGESAPDLDGGTQQALLELFLKSGGGEGTGRLVRAIAEGLALVRRSTGALTAAGLQLLTRLNSLGITP